MGLLQMKDYLGNELNFQLAVTAVWKETVASAEAVNLFEKELPEKVTIEGNVVTAEAVPYSLIELKVR